MKLPVQIEFRDMAPLPSLEPEIRERIQRLERFASDLMSCHVVVDSAGNRHRQGHVYSVKVDLRLQGGEIFAGEHQASGNIELAMHGAFDALTRQLEDHVRRRREPLKQHGDDPAS